MGMVRRLVWRLFCHAGDQYDWPITGDYRVIRGGSWEDYGIPDTRGACRISAYPNNGSHSMAFRCVSVTPVP